jgi:hypothetical protein
MCFMDAKVAMTDQSGLVLSVRGESTLTVSADSALLSGAIQLSPGLTATIDARLRAGPVALTAK